MIGPIFRFRYTLIVYICLACSVLSYGQTDTLKDVKPFVGDIRELLVGQTPGTVAVSSFGSPGMKPSVYIRGLHLFNENPAFYVDGVMVYDLGLIAPESIEKIEVVSGAEAVMRFGPNAANGALAVTTREASRTGFHASYSLTGAMHQLAWEPEQITLEEWNKYWPYTVGGKQNPYLLDKYKASFAQNHHLNLQYGGGKLSVATSFDFLDNDGPMVGRKDTQKRFSGNAKIEYRPLDWLRIELSGGAGRSYSSCLSVTTESYLSIMYSILNNEPLMGTETAQDVISNLDNEPYHDGLSALALVEVHPVSGLAVRGYYGFSKENLDSYRVGWKKEQESFSVTNGTFEDWYWYQYGIDADYLMPLGDHTLQFVAAAKRLYYDYSNVNSLTGMHALDEYGIPFGDYAAVKTKFIDPGLENWSISNPQGFSFSRWSGKDNLTDLSLNVNYDWNKRLYAGVGLYKRLKEALSYSGNLKWVPMDNWSVFGSYVKTNTIYHNSRFNTIHVPLPAEFSRLDAGAEASLKAGAGVLNLRVLGFLDNDYYIDGNQYHIEDSGLKIRNEGIEAGADWSGQTGDISFNAGASLTMYRNKTLSMDESITAIGFGHILYIKEGYPLKVAWLKKFEGVDKETGAPVVGERDYFGNGVFPTSALGLHGSIAWKNLQLSVRGHGNFGQSVVHSHRFDMLARHYLTNSWIPENKDAKYPHFGWFQTVSESSAALQDASFFRIDQIRLDYTMPVNRINGFITLFLSLENYFLFTSYPGSDPEYLLEWNTMGEDRGLFPSTKRIVTGLKISF